MGKRETVTEYLSDIHESYGGGLIYVSGFWWDLEVRTLCSREHSLSVAITHRYFLDRVPRDEIDRQMSDLHRNTFGYSG